MQFDVNLFVGLMHAVVLIGLLCAVAAGEWDRQTDSHRTVT